MGEINKKKINSDWGGRGEGHYNIDNVDIHTWILPHNL